MKAIVVYESHWGNTASIAHAIAAGLGPDVTPSATLSAGSRECRCQVL